MSKSDSLPDRESDAKRLFDKTPLNFSQSEKEILESGDIQAKTNLLADHIRTLGRIDPEASVLLETIYKSLMDVLGKIEKRDKLSELITPKTSDHQEGVLSEEVSEFCNGWLGGIDAKSRRYAREHIRQLGYTTVLDVPCGGTSETKCRSAIPD